VVGATDGSFTEVSGDGVKAGMKVVIGESRNADFADDIEPTTNPFIPNIQRGGKPKTN
jgi:hypothetical protein